MEREGIVPECAILRKVDSTSLNLRYYGCGKRLMMALADGIGRLPVVEYVDLRDNRLRDSKRDDTVKRLLTSLAQQKSLRSLDFSRNTLRSPGCHVLATDIISTSKTLEALYLSHANLRDAEMVILCDALASTSSLKVLDLSHNALGGHAAQLLSDIMQTNSSITNLDVSWNLMRLQGAQDIANGIKLNGAGGNGILHFNCSSNGFGDSGARALDGALAENTCLLTLDLSNNNITTPGALFIARGLSKNKTLTRLVMDGNLIGIDGVMHLRRSAKTHVKSRQIEIVHQNCGVPLTHKVQFNRMDPDGIYALDLEEKYDRNVAEQLLKLANEKPGYEIDHVLYRPSNSTERQEKELHVRRLPAGIVGIFATDAAILFPDVVGNQTQTQDDKSAQNEISLIPLLLPASGRLTIEFRAVVHKVLQKIKVQSVGDVSGFGFFNQSFYDTASSHRNR